MNLKRPHFKSCKNYNFKAFSPEHTPDILAFDAIDPPPYLGADLAIARDMDDIITFASPRNPTAQISVVRPDNSGAPPPSVSSEVDDRSSVSRAIDSR